MSDGTAAHRERIMAHLVAYFPNEQACLDIARALVDGGCTMLEVQFPFSDPTADGVLIQKACAQSLARGFRVQGGFELLAALRAMTEIPIFVMSYANLVVARGVESFLRDCSAVSVQGVIIPDLPPDYDEGLFALGKALGLEVIPVIAPTVSDQRLDLYAHTDSQYIYTALRKGITGAFTHLGAENIRFLQKVSATGKRILAGFGVQARSQVEALSRYVYASVIGSLFIRVIEEHPIEALYAAVLRKMLELSGMTDVD